VSAPKGKVFIVDDDQQVLKSLSRLLRSANLEPIPFSSPQAFLEHHVAFRDSCLVLDLSMPGIDGMQLQRSLEERNETIPIIFLTGHGDIPTAVQALQRGAVNFLTKPVESSVLLSVIDEALRIARAAWLEKEEGEDIRMRVERLTSREREVMDQVVTGKLNKQIASDLGIAEKTVKVHRARVMQKMEVVSVADLVRIVQRIPAQSEQQPPGPAKPVAGDSQNGPA
jgi:FixJ family two-component response regulator